MKQAVRAPRAASAERAGAAEQPGARAGLLALLGQLGLGQLQLLVDQPGGLLRELLEQLAEGPVAQVLAVAGNLGGHHDLRSS